MTLLAMSELRRTAQRCAGALAKQSSKTFRLLQLTEPGCQGLARVSLGSLVNLPQLDHFPVTWRDRGKLDAVTQLGRGSWLQKLLAKAKPRTLLRCVSRPAGKNEHGPVFDALRSLTRLCDTQPPPETGSGKFYFKNGATYDGEWMKVPQPKAEGTETKPADAKAAAAAAAAAAEQPDASQIMRHGNGELTTKLIAARHVVLLPFNTSPQPNTITSLTSFFKLTTRPHMIVNCFRLLCGRQVQVFWQLGKRRNAGNRQIHVCQRVSV